MEQTVLLCTAGHPQPHGQTICTTCGSAVYAYPASAVGGRTAARRFSPAALTAIIGGVLVAVIVITTAIVAIALRDTSSYEAASDGSVLSVSVGDENSDDCAYSGRHLGDGELILLDADRSIIGRVDIQGEAEERAGGCYWDVEFTDLPETSAFVIEYMFYSEYGDLSGDVTYTREEVIGENWSISLTTNV